MPDSSDRKVGDGSREVVVGTEQLVHALKRYGHHRGDLRRAHEVIAHDNEAT
jgi:hypothetical protein